MQNLPKVKTSRVLHKDLFEIRQDILEKDDGIGRPYTKLLCGDAVAILAQDPHGRWVLNREYRHGAGQILIGCPGGRLEEGEDPIEGAKREFLEETGYCFETSKLIGCCHPFPALCNQRISFVFAQNAIQTTAQSLDPLECIEPILLSDQELKTKIQQGELVDGILLTALWLYGL